MSRPSPAMQALRKLDNDPAYDEVRIVGRMVATLNQLALGLVNRESVPDVGQLLLDGGFTQAQIERYAQAAMVTHKAFIGAGGNGPEPKGSKQ